MYCTKTKPGILQKIQNNSARKNTLADFKKGCYTMGVQVKISKNKKANREIGPILADKTQIAPMRAII